jgi:SpoVK/Ycf46/Vps4 family AAA+-type ATPase
MRLAEKYRPQSLADVVGQPCIRKLQRFAKEPFATCWLFQGSPGTGKSATALALAAELGAVDAFSGLEVICTANMGKAEAEAAVKRLHLRCLAGEWNVVVLEELERLSPQCQVFLKVALASENLPPRAVVIATSNDTSLIDPALLERFGKPLRFDAWQAFADAGAERLAAIWSRESDGAPLPKNADYWGWHLDERAKPQRYSLRSALDALQQALLDLPEPAGVAA